MAAFAMNIFAFTVLAVHCQQAVGQEGIQVEALSMIQKSAAIKRGKASKAAQPSPEKQPLEATVPMQVLTDGVCSAQGTGTCGSNSAGRVKRAGGMKAAMPEADSGDIFSDGMSAAVQFSQKSATVHRAKPSLMGFQMPESSLDTSGLGYERVSADVLAVLREESGLLEEGIAMVQKSASIHRVGVNGDGQMSKLATPATQPQQPMAWEPVDPDLDIMSLIEEEEGISMVQKNVAAIRGVKKKVERSDAGKEKAAKLESSPAAADESEPAADPEVSTPQEGLSLLQLDAQYKLKQRLLHV